VAQTRPALHSPSACLQPSSTKSAPRSVSSACAWKRKHRSPDVTSNTSTTRHACAICAPKNSSILASSAKRERERHARSQRQVDGIRGAIEERQAEFEALSKQVETVAINITAAPEVDAQVFGLNWRPLYQLKIAAREGLDGLADYAASMTAFVFLSADGLAVVNSRF